MTTGTQAKIQTRTATMRHTATLEVELNYAKERALLGVNFAGDIESLLDWQHMGAEWLCSQISTLLEARKGALEAASQQRGRFGAGVDTAQFADEA
jgi:hypothetical protein